MIIPIANAIFEKKINIEDFYRTNLKKKIVNNLVFHEVNQKIFPTIKLKEIVNKRPSTPIIINASNEVLVDQFLAKNIAFFDIYKYIMSVLRDKILKNML